MKFEAIFETFYQANPYIYH